jgi:hypothetical protein
MVRVTTTLIQSRSLPSEIVSRYLRSDTWYLARHPVYLGILLILHIFMFVVAENILNEHVLTRTDSDHYWRAAKQIELQIDGATVISVLFPAWTPLCCASFIHPSS